MKVAVIGGGITGPMRIALGLAVLGRAMTVNRQAEELVENFQRTDQLTIDQLRATLPPNDDPFKPCRRSKGEKARNRKQRRG